MAQWVTAFAVKCKNQKPQNPQKKQSGGVCTCNPSIMSGVDIGRSLGLANSHLRPKLNERLCLTGIRCRAIEQETQNTPLAATHIYASK